MKRKTVIKLRLFVNPKKKATVVFRKGFISSTGLFIVLIVAVDIIIEMYLVVLFSFKSDKIPREETTSAFDVRNYQVLENTRGKVMPDFWSIKENSMSILLENKSAAFCAYSCYVWLKRQERPSLTRIGLCQRK
jgi:hypothetical protein